ncbi:MULTISPECIES: hypothetical protein [Bradyrhizobium]|jgi:hypothetical protein|uniref:hypothetical protein n=1 Tax=Bradyrhizobium TaxID=374 RepID=UPI0003F8FD39|nr:MULTISPECIES: hypothetical protein [Bradyrhizobium]RZN15795.1 hypothetical protein CWO90_41065 [Bradyrhizobium sp. Leo121]
MANEQQANKARELNSRELLKCGAHAIGVEAGKDHGKRGWVVVAHVAPEANVTLPPALTVATEKGDVQVPLVCVRSEPFKPE